MTEITREKYLSVRERVDAKNVLLKLYDLGRITIGLTTDHRFRFNYRAEKPNEDGIYDWASMWTIESIEHHANLLIGNKQREIQRG